MNNLDENLHVKAKVNIGGKNTTFVSLIIEQEYGQHHTFSISMDYDALGHDFMTTPGEQIDLIGKIVRIDLQHGDNIGGAYIFRGIVTKVKVTGESGKHGPLIVEGASPTIAFDRGRRTDIYSNMTLRKVFELIKEGTYHEYIKMVNEPTFENKIDFLMQYNETDWEFMQRVAYQFGENLFYSGYEILFGAYEEWDAVPLTYDKEISDIQFCSRMLPNEFTSYLYQADQDSIVEKESPEDIENSNEYLNHASERNHILTMLKNPKEIIDAPITEREELNEMVKRRKTRTAAQTVYLSGSAKTYEPYIGRLISVSMPEGMGGRKLGTYRVIKSIHRVDQNLRYHNDFEAVPAKLKTMPVREPKMPSADSVLAIVSSNADPKGLGRVQVDFPFATEYSRIWMRVITPNAGSSDVIEKNRGLVFIPEKGDQVMVGFELGDPNRPYVLGSLFHGNNGEGGGTDNHIKSIITKSGHTIEFDDAKDTLGITIKDVNGNIIHLDSKGKNIEITAPETITLKATDIRMEASNNIEMQAEAAIKADAMAEVHIGAQSDIDIVTESNIQTKSLGATNITAKTDMQIEGQSATLKSASNTEVSGMDTAIKGQTTKVSGASHKVEIV